MQSGYRRGSIDTVKTVVVSDGGPYSVEIGRVSATGGPDRGRAS